MEQRSNRFFVYIIASIAALGGLLFGFDTGVISGAVLFIRHSFPLTNLTEGIIIASVLLGALFGSGCAGQVTDHFGRRNVIIATSLIFTIGSIVCAIAPSLEVLIFGRLILGVAIGIASFAAPLYIAEVAPSQYRGALVSLNQLAITIGIMASYFIDYGFSHVENNWRWMLGVGFVPAVILLIGMFFLPESPRWMMLKGYKTKARQTLQAIRNNDEVEAELAEIETMVAQKQDSEWKMLCAKWLRPALVLGFALAFLQQMTGINTIIYYAPTIFQMAGIESSENAILATSIVGSCNVLFTVIGILLVDRIGRRPLLLWGLAGMGIALLIMAVSFLLSTQSLLLQWLTLLSMLLYIASFAASLGIVVWIMLSEIFPLEIRGLAMSLATAATWAFNFIVSFSFLMLISWLGKSNTFLVYTILCFVGFIFVLLVVPETKSITLEHIEANLRAGKRPRELGLSHT